jgi:hypothetical protein
VNRENPRQEDRLALIELQIDHSAVAFKPAPIIHICARSKSCGQASVWPQIGRSGAQPGWLLATLGERPDRLGRVRWWS